MSINNSYPLSSMQQGMLLQSLHESGTYTQQVVCDLLEDVNETLLRQAWQEVAARHDILRTAFRWEGIAEPLQDVYDEVELPWRNEDWSPLPPEQQQQQLNDFLLTDRKSSFDVTNAPLMRCVCFKLDVARYRVVWTFHHALLDGRSHFIVLQEVFSLYDAWLTGTVPAVPPRRSYGDYVYWLQQQQWSEHFWREYLRGFKPPPDLRIGDGDLFQKQPNRPRQPASLTSLLPEDLTAALTVTARKNEITVNTIVQASWALLLSRYYGSQDIVFGTTRACRHATVPGSESMVGLFINTLPMRVKVDPRRHLLDWLKHLRQQQINLRDYEQTPLTKIQEWSDAPRGKSLFETVLVFESYELNERIAQSNSLDGHSSARHFELLEQTHYPLTLAAYAGSRLLLKLGYDERRFDVTAIEAMLGHLTTLLEGMATTLDRRVGQLSMLSAAERQQLLFDWNQMAPTQGSSECLHQIFSEQVKRSPTATAVVFEDRQLSFAELDDKATQLARYLEKLGVGPEVLVAICIERSIEMIVGILGIIKAGGAYLPMDPASPMDRLSFMLQDSGASVVLTQQSLRDGFLKEHRSVISLDTDWKVISAQNCENLATTDGMPAPLTSNAVQLAAAVTPLNLAYVIYTSGSTGQPKGVMVTHENIVRLFETTHSLFGFDHNDVWTLFHSYAFDFSVWEMWGALLYGGILVVVPYWISRAPKKFYQLLRSARATVLNQTPSAFRQLLDAESETRNDASGAESSLRLVILGGEALDGASVGQWFEGHGENQPQLINMYGITETTVHVTYHQVKRHESGLSGRSLIGRPIDDLQVYILDEQQEPVPVGVAGEIYVSGGGLSRGYLNRPDLTAERFLPHPFSEKPGERLYRTGDVARFLRTGDIEYLGRSDRQVKIRGFRIELDEVEKCLARHHGVDACAVILREDHPGVKSLVAYVVTTLEQITTNELRIFLTGKLPDYMLPAIFVHLEKLPLTENGKLDRNALPPPPDHSAEEELIPPRNSTEQIIAGIWCEVLGLKTVSVFEDFFAVGGDSLRATQVVSRAGVAFQIDLPLGALFEQRTVAALAGTVEEIQDSQSTTGAGAQSEHDTGISLVMRTEHTTKEIGGTSMPQPGVEPFVFPPSFAQQRLWFLEQFDPGKSVYHLLYAVRFDGSLNLNALEQALNELVRRHESLRTSFVTVDGEPMQAIARELKLELPVIDLLGLGKDNAEAEARRWWQIEGERPFDLTAAPMFRVHLLRLSADENVLVITLHHIISDGWSMGVFLRELSALYQAFREGQPSPLPELPIQYADYSVWQREWMQGEVLESQLSYWTKHLAGAPAALELATDRPHPAAQTFAGARHFTEISSDLADRLRAFSRREGVTLFMTLLAAFDVLLWRYSEQEDVVVGIPLGGRSKPELEDLIGLFANTLPLRANLSGNPTFREFLQRVREGALGAYAHQETPFDKLVEAMQPERSLSHAPLFQVIFALENTPALDHNGVALEWLEVDRGTARNDLSLFMSDKGGALSAIWEYSADLFDGETIRGMISNYSALLESILQDPTEKIGYLEIWSEGERRELLTKWNLQPTASANPLCVHQQFEAQAASTPNAVAVVCGENSLTYAELNTRANQIAHQLQRLGVEPETPVGVYLERSLDMMVALLGVLKSGGAYVPLDVGYPADRLAFMLEDSRVPVLLTESKLLSTLQAQTNGMGAQLMSVCLDDWSGIASEDTSNPKSSVTPENLAYIIYTSGSTGRPKGVEVTHQTVVHLFAATRGKLGFRSGDVWTVVHSSAFDFSVWEIWGCLLQGGTLVVVPLEVLQSPGEFFDLLCRERVTILNQTPSALRELLAAREHALQERRDWSLRLIVCGGDALDQELAVELRRLQIPVWNFYGPTESTVWTTCTRVAQTSVCATSPGVQSPPETQTEVCATSTVQSPLGTQTEVCATSTVQSPPETHTEVCAVSIGPPLPDLQVYLLNQQLQPVPAGVPGELVIGGAGLARGYLRRPELTAEKFIPNPFSDQPGTRLYRTGDLARHRRDGRIEFIGRIDNQVKLRGFRVELGEIESALTEHADVAQAVVVIRQHPASNDRRLVAYIVPRDSSAPAATELRKHLRLTLPDYMVPSAFVTLAEIPLTTNKKVDRLALPDPERTEESTEDFIAPQTPIEELIAEIWMQVLRGGPIGVHDNFFDLGGHSLLATQVTARLRQTLNIDFPVRALFEGPTVAAMAGRVEQIVQGGGGLQVPPILAITKNGKLPLSFAQQRLWFLDQLEPGNAFYNIGRALRLRGSLDITALTASINQIITRHESLRTCFDADDGTPFQRIVNHAPLILPIVDLQHLSENDREAELERLAAEEVKHPFDLTQGPLLRGKLIRIADRDHVLVLTMHHIAADEWSLAVLFRELTRLYDAFTRGEPSPLPGLPIQYADYAAWQRRWLQGEMQEKLVSYWRKQLAGVPTVMSLPTDKPRPPVQSFRGAYEEFEMPRALLDDLKRLSRSEGVTLFMTCLAAYQLLLARFSGQQDLLVGTDVANRTRVETESLIGFFTNLLPLRANLTGDLEFAGLLRQVRETTLEGYAHQDLPFEKLVEELRPERDLGRNPMVQVLLVMQNPEVPIELTKLDVSRYDLPLESSRFDIVLFLSAGEQGLSGFWLYNPDLFEAATIARLSDNYQKLLGQIVARPSARLDSFEILVDEPRKRPGLKEMNKKDLHEARLNRLRNIRRSSVDLSQVSSVRTGFLEPEQTLPLLIEPGNADIDLAEWAAGNRPFIDENLLRHGALLFRGFAVDSVPEFESFASAICPRLFGEYGDLPREELGGKVYGSTPYPADEQILFHNESSHLHQWPMLIWFYCVKPSLQGGESPIIDCRRIYQALDPLIREKFESKGLMYVRNFTDGLDVSWQDFFHTSDRTVVESYCRKASIDFEWKGDNGLRTRQISPAVAKHPQTGEPVFFNQLQLHHIFCLAPAVRESLLAMMSEEDLPRNVYYGDGSTIEDSVMEHIGELYQKLGVTFPWARHDVLMLNNMLVAHSRNPYVGERKIVVALGDLMSKEEIERRHVVT